MSKNADEGSFFMDMINHECYNKSGLTIYQLRGMSCNCMTRTSQQECRGILELFMDIEIRMKRNWI